MDSYTRLRSDSCDRIYSALHCARALVLRLSRLQSCGFSVLFVHDTELIPLQLQHCYQKRSIIVKKIGMLFAVVSVLGTMAQLARAQTLVASVERLRYYHWFSRYSRVWRPSRWPDLGDPGPSSRSEGGRGYPG
jgi:hypothetical protein